MSRLGVSKLSFSMPPLARYVEPGALSFVSARFGSGCCINGDGGLKANHRELDSDASSRASRCGLQPGDDDQLSPVDDDQLECPA
ncbi:hypothetical protein ZHAS_00012562 [Anopheles sinensis]|uniref:Uncharacterized protein n=1 Tax=Anopheles sinensis TaxID=74873 RepID=A0A084W366_ANOSI|nr:hypothetical protein ZHAS_00012562 [Anopheles sinensis]